RTAQVHGARLFNEAGGHIIPPPAQVLAMTFSPGFLLRASMALLPDADSGSYKRRHKCGAFGALLLSNCAGDGEGGRRWGVWPLSVVQRHGHIRQDLVGDVGAGAEQRPKLLDGVAGVGGEGSQGAGVDAGGGRGWCPRGGGYPESTNPGRVTPAAGC